MTLAVLPEKPLFTQTLQQQMPQPVASAVCTPSEMMTTTIPQNEKTVSKFFLISMNYIFFLKIFSKFSEPFPIFHRKQQFHQNDFFDIFLWFLINLFRLTGNQTQFRSDEKYVKYDASGANKSTAIAIVASASTHRRRRITIATFHGIRKVQRT